MKFTTIALLAVATPALAQSGSDWVTYTKSLASTTVTVTRYLGTSTFLSGTQFTTKTVIASSNGTPVYTEVVTGVNTA
ncbi:hypothetical protein BON22_3740 [Cyberlindnera fabianii]|uniref:Uncharacterized protein n=1 Tax=Cyberlindnera fabianii TaxID=36022 RepID=A0A1V2L3S1_CYBFA|nr:hypothetical protein BON22_3740 [Cyberlindnera fabianii]